jgi:hypothetical protein
MSVVITHTLNEWVGRGGHEGNFKGNFRAVRGYNHQMQRKRMFLE